jgi:hypothetical protein
MGTDAVGGLIREIVRAHGGSDLWRGLESVEAIISARGFLFTTKRRPPLDRVRMRAWTREPRFAFFDYPHTGQTAKLIGTREVRIVEAGTGSSPGAPIRARRSAGCEGWCAGTTSTLSTSRATRPGTI